MTSPSNSEQSAEPRTVPGNQPGDYGVGDAGRYGADPSNTEDIERLTAPLDDDDDVRERLNQVSLVNTEQPDELRQAPDGRC